MSNSDLLEVVQTKAALLKQNNKSEYKVTLFEKHKSTISKNLDVFKTKTVFDSSKEKKEGSEDEEEEPTQRKRKKRDDTEFDIKRARNEVINFAISGHNLKDRKEAQIAMAVKLGAKPPKKEYQNYKEMLTLRKEIKRKEEKQKKLQLTGKNQYGAATVKCFSNKKQHRKKVVNEISKHYGVINPKLKKKK